MGLIDLPQSKWGPGTGRQPILKGDFAKVEAAILQLFMAAPAIERVDATEIKVPATADCPAQAMMKGFPNILHPALWVGGGLTDGRYRENVADATMDFDLAASLWGTKKFRQWYAIYALAGNADVVFTLKAMPWMRVKSQASQVISLGTNVTPATGIGYGLVTDELVGGMIYVLTGASKGLMRTITANNNDNGTGGTITYSGTALTLAAGDVFIVLPPGTNFRWLRDIYNDAAGNLGLGNLFFAEVSGLVSTQFPSAVSNITFPNLTPGVQYRLRFELSLGGSGNAIGIQFNDDGTNYNSFCWEPTAGLLTRTNWFLIANNIPNAAITSGSIEFSSLISNSHIVNISGQSLSTRTPAVVSGFYNGAADLTNVTLLADANVLTGKIWLERVG